ncbi:MAG TPA: tetratricopeptide repeat protein [Rhizomicrobium sp.]
MKRLLFLGAVCLAATLCNSSVLLAQSGQAGGMNPSGNSTFGGGGASQLSFNDYATGLRLLHAEQYEDAIPFLDRALANRPHSADIMTYLGYAHRMAGDFSDARALYQKAISTDPDNKGAHERLGELDLAVHDPASADAQMVELTRLCPDGCKEKDALATSVADFHAAATPASSH